MSHFAEIDKNNIVLRVIVAEQDFIDSGIVGNKKNWIQTSYNTYRGVHKDNKTPLRKNYASPGHTYDKTKDAFIRPKPFDSWSFNEDTCDWDAPVDYPTEWPVGHPVEAQQGSIGEAYLWDEENQQWLLAFDYLE